MLGDGHPIRPTAWDQSTRRRELSRKRPERGNFKYNAHHMLNLMEEIASDEVLEQAYQWLCDRRKNYSHNDDVWEVWYRWTKIKPLLQAELIAGLLRQHRPQHSVRPVEGAA